MYEIKLNIIVQNIECMTVKTIIAFLGSFISAEGKDINCFSPLRLLTK